MALELLVTEEAICLDKAPGEPGAKVVACNSEKAAYQLVAKGTPISQEDADRFGVKTKKADLANYTLRIDSHTIARTPEDKAFALTQPQPGLVMAKTEQIRSAAALAVASLATAEAAKAADATEESKQAAAEEDKKLKAKLEDKSAKPAKAPRKARATRKSKKEEAAKPATP